MGYNELASELIRLNMLLLRQPGKTSFMRALEGESITLATLRSFGGSAYPKQLSDALNVSTARIAALLKVMENKGYISRSSDPDDNRRTIVTLEKAGQKLIDDSFDRVLGIIAQTLERMGTDHAEQYVALKRELVEKGIAGSD